MIEEEGNKLMKIYNTLLREFGPQGWWPTISRGKKNKQFEIILGAILTQNTSWKNVEKSIKILHEKGLLNREAVSSLPKKKLADLIRSSGYYNQKARKIKEFLKYSGPVERSELLKIWGLGPETVDSILLYAYGEPIFVVDAYTKRIFARVGMKPGNKNSNSTALRRSGSSLLYDYELWQSLFHSNLPKDADVYSEYHALLVELAKRHCTTTPVCQDCPVSSMCKRFVG